MSDLQKLFASNILNSLRFVTPIFVFYFTEMRDIPLGTVFQILGIYYAATVIFEYPTGVIGDHFSHKLSVLLGGFISAIALLLLSLPGEVFWYIFCALLLALGEALISGSDTALFQSVSSNFQSDYARMRFFALLSTFAAMSLGGIVATIDLRLPIYLSAGASFLGSCIILFIQTTKSSSVQGNIFSTAKNGLVHVHSTPILQYLLVVSLLLSGFFFFVKWIYNPLFETLGLPLELWGLLAGIAPLMIAFGAKAYHKNPHWNISLTGTMLLLSICGIGMIFFAVLSLTSIYIAFFLRGYIETSLTVRINHHLIDGIRASIFSLNSLLIRGAAMLFTFVSGILIEQTSLTFFLFGTAAFLFLAGCYPISKIIAHEKLASKSV